VDRDHALCRNCRQIVRTDWRECAHCGICAPVPRSPRDVVTLVAPWLAAAMIGGAWWAYGSVAPVGRVVASTGRVVLPRAGAEPPLGRAPGAIEASSAVAGDRGTLGTLPNAGPSTRTYTAVGGVAPPSGRGARLQPGSVGPSVRASLAAAWRSVRGASDTAAVPAATSDTAPECVTGACTVTAARDSLPPRRAAPPP
jgi:hypothetical protein